MTRLLMICVFFCSLHAYAAQPQKTYQGINLPGAEFNNKKLPGIAEKDYHWPTLKNFQRMQAAGFNTVRVPFLWGRLQLAPLGEFSATEIKQLDRVVQQTAQLQLNIVLDVHNYASYDGRYLTNTAEDIAVFRDLWSRLASRYKDYPNVIFGLMNEPNRQPANIWFDLAQAGVSAIRDSGARQLILVPGTAWTGMHKWLTAGSAGSNADVLLNIHDPLDHYAYEMHQYFDSDYSGTHAECVDSDRFVRLFGKVNDWLRSHQKKAFLGEFGASLTPQCVEDLRTTIDILNKNKDLWIGWTYWATSDWMNTYMFNPFTGDPDDPRLKILQDSLEKQSAGS